MTTVVTSWSPRGWGEYGSRFLSTWEIYWPRDVRLVVYVEGQRIDHELAEFRNLNSLAPFAGFEARHRDDPVAKGLVQCRGWRSKDIAEGYSWRHDAYKFCRKVFVLADAARLAMDRGERILAWIDGDVVTRQAIPRRFIEQMLGHFDVAYLGRRGTHSECGFMAYRLPEAYPIIERLEYLYASDEVFALNETHDSFVFDHVRRQLGGVRQKDLTPNGWGHTWLRSALWPYLDHLKGGRKALGRSPEQSEITG